MDTREGFGDFPVERLDDIGDITEGKQNRCTGKQRQWIYSMISELGINDREALSYIGKEFLADEFNDPLREMTLEDASLMIDELKILIEEQRSSEKNNSIGGWF